MEMPVLFYGTVIFQPVLSYGTVLFWPVLSYGTCSSGPFFPVVRCSSGPFNGRTRNVTDCPSKILVSLLIIRYCHICR